MKKLFCALLVLLLTLSFFAACSDGKKTTGALKTAETAETGKKADDNLDEWGREKVASAIPADKKFGGETVNFVLDGSRGSEFFVDSLTGDLMNDAVYNRNLKVENDLEVKLNFIVTTGSAGTDFAAAVSRVVLSGTGDYDLISGYAYFLTSSVRNWCYANLKDIESESSMDLTKPWWNRFYVSEATVYDQLYTVTGDLAITSKSAAGCIFFNKRLADEHLSAWGGTAGLYKLVEDGDWTIDIFTDICKDIYNDADGDGQRSEGDFYAFGSWWSSPIPADAFQFGMDARITRMDENGVPYFDYGSERSAIAVEKLWSLNNDCAGVLYSQSYYNNSEKHWMMINKFINGTMIFCAETLVDTQWFGDMKDDFGLLPMPKFNKDQNRYYTSQGDDYSAFAVAADVSDREKVDVVGTTLEKLNEESYRTVAPNFFETVMKYRYLRTDAENQKDIKMYDLILEGNNFNFGLIYSSVLGDISFGYRSLIGANNSKNLESFWRGSESGAKTKLNNLLNDFAEE